eukprot:c5226_g1_i1 orf=3-458(-)
MCHKTNGSVATHSLQEHPCKQSTHSSTCKQSTHSSPVILAILTPIQHSIIEKEPPHQVDNDDLKRLPTTSEVVEELKHIGSIAGPMICLYLLLYGRMVTSMFFLGRLGELELAGGSLAIGLANITCYSVLSGLALGMEPICGQAFGAKRWSM